MPDSIAVTPLAVELPEEFRLALGLESNATAAEALNVAETRLKDTLDKQQKLPERHPSQPRLKKDREKLEPLVRELREMVFGIKVDAFCDSAEAALGQHIPSKAAARDFLKRARLEGKNLPPDSVYMKRVAQLEARLAGEAPPPPAPGPAPKHQTSRTVPAPQPAPMVPPPAHKPPPENPFLKLEKLMDEGMACFLQTPPDLPNAEKCFAAAEQESNGKTIPDTLKSRMQFFRTTLDRLRKDVVRGQIDRLLKEVNTCLGSKPPKTSQAREKLAHAATMLKDAPDPRLQHELDMLTGEVQRFEHHTERKPDDNAKSRELRVQVATRVRFRIRHEGQETTREVKALQFVIGRGSQGEDTSLDLGFDLRCSRRHARVWSEGGFFWIEDLGSKFGTKLDGTEIKGAGRRHLKPLSKVQIGDTVLTLLEDDTAVAPFQPLPAQGTAKSDVEIDSSLDAEVTILRGGKGESPESFMQRQSWLLELHLELAKQKNLTDLLTMILQRAIAAISGAARGAVLLKSKDSDALLLTVYSPPEGDPPVSETLVRKALKEAAAFMWRRTADSDPAESIRRLSIESGIYAPMIRDGRPLGVICVDNPDVQSNFKPEDLRLMTALAHYAAMAVSNQQMQDDLRENATLLERLLTNFSPKLRHRIVSKAREGRLKPGGERSEITILFADMRGFTLATTNRDADEVMELLNDYLPALAQVVFDHEGTIDKFTGDGLLAVFGSPEPDPDQHRHALLAAWEMQLAMKRMSERRLKSGKIACELGVGVHSGDVLHGFLGGAELLEFTVIGDAVNRASRFCAGAPPGAVLLSPEVFQHVSQYVRAEPLVIETKREGNTNAYRVLELKQPNEAAAVPPIIPAA
jgi:adenylate cyclase